MERPGKACVDCLKIHGHWVHLRECLTCGHIACCDSSEQSPRQQALLTLPSHPIITSPEEGETWAHCYPARLGPLVSAVKNPPDKRGNGESTAPVNRSFAPSQSARARCSPRLTDAQIARILRPSAGSDALDAGTICSSSRGRAPVPFYVVLAGDAGRSVHPKRG